MTQLSDPQTSPPNPVNKSVPVTPRDVQRAALLRLVDLVTASAAEEAEIESRRAAAVAIEAKTKSKLDTELENAIRVGREKINLRHAERIAEIDAKFSADLSVIENHRKQQRRLAEHERDGVLREVKKHIDNATWLAESLHDGTVVQLKADYKKAKEEVEKQQSELAEIEIAALKLMETFSLRPDPVEEPLRSPAPAPPAAKEEYVAKRAAAEKSLSGIRHLVVPRLFVGVTPVLIFIALVAVTGAIAQLQTGSLAPIAWRPLSIAVPAAAAVTIIGLIVLRMIGLKQTRRAWIPFRDNLADARQACDKQLEFGKITRDEAVALEGKKRDDEITAAKEKYGPPSVRAKEKFQASVGALDTDFAQRSPALSHRKQQVTAETDRWKQTHEKQADDHVAAENAKLVKRNEDAAATIQADYQSARTTLEQKWTNGLETIRSTGFQPVPQGAYHDARHGLETRATSDWSTVDWANWPAIKSFPPTVRFGELEIDLGEIVRQTPGAEAFTLPLPDRFAVPAVQAFPKQASILIESDRGGREKALSFLQAAMTRVVTSLPAGRARFTIIDPVGLGQNFAGFMHLADYDEHIVGPRIWTSSEHIEQRLNDLTEHMETVIQKYLRNEFETIDDYNAQAGELAEPYRFLVIGDFPLGFEGETYRRLNSIASTGARCGVYILLHRDRRQALSQGNHIDEVESNSIRLVQQGDTFVWQDEVFSKFPLTLDTPPNDETLTKIVGAVGRYAKDANRVEVPFSQIAPKTEQIWGETSAKDLHVPIGRMGATRQQFMRLGRGVAQHALIAGKTGSGKSTLLHAIITNLAMWYRPDEIELYLVDFKKGVEFKAYANQNLPHARAIAVESDREFGLSVLQRIDAELSRRGEMYRKLGVQDLNGYREASGQPLPRTLLVVDEFQEFFNEDDRVSQESAMLLDRLVRQGRAFGIHVLLGSQTIAGSSGLSRATLGQMAVRVALQCNEADSQLILGDNNSAARLLTRPGEAIYNDAGGLVEANSPFQIAWLPDEQRDAMLADVRRRADESGDVYAKIDPVIFEGNAAAEIERNVPMRRAIDDASTKASTPLAWLGEPVAIKDPTAVSMRLQSGSNMLIIGQQDESSIAMLMTSIVGLAAQHAKNGAEFYVLDGTPADSPFVGQLPALKDVVPQAVNVVEYRGLEEALTTISAELARRQALGEVVNEKRIYVIVCGLQRYRSLRKQEESFSFGSSDEPKAVAPDKQFADLLREGPAMGIHVLAWCDTPASVERTLDRSSLREFDHRILFQMSANDSSNLIDSPAANKLGFHRALSYSEEAGVMEKFRPYGLPPKAWLEDVKARLRSRGV